VTEAILHLKFEKVKKTTQIVPQTLDNHLEQLVLGLVLFIHFSLKKV